MHRALVDALAHDLAAASFTSGGVVALVGADADAALTRMVAQPARRAALREPGPLATLLRALWLGDTVSDQEMADALPSLGLAGAVALGIVEHRDGTAIPQMAIRPYAFRDALGDGEWWIASDLDELAGVWPLRPDHVLGVGGAARTLAALLPPVDAASALDVGTGCGVIALHLRRFAERVVATDISERALRFTELTARLNGVDGIETRLGSLFEPVAGERFELIASNPPFVITPRAEGVPAYEYRDGGAAGDALMAAVVAGLHEHLAPGGHARLLGNWETLGDTAGLDRVRAWTGVGVLDTGGLDTGALDTGGLDDGVLDDGVLSTGSDGGSRGTGDLDVWAIERDSLDPVRYAELWLRDGGTLPRDAEHDALMDAWLDDFDARGVVAVGMGWLALHRPDAGAGPSLARFERLGQAVQLEHAGAHFADAFAAAAWLSGVDDAALEREHLLAAPDVTEARHQLPGAAGPNVIELRQGGALARTLSVDTALAALVGACDGELSVGQLIGAIASLLEVDERILAADLLPRVRELVLTGFLRSVSD